MKTKFFAVGLTVLILQGCEMEMSTQQVVDKLDECKKAGLQADVYRMFGDAKVVDIQCVPPQEKRK